MEWVAAGKPGRAPPRVLCDLELLSADRHGRAKHQHVLSKRDSGLCSVSLAEHSGIRSDPNGRAGRGGFLTSKKRLKKGMWCVGDSEVFLPKRHSVWVLFATNIASKRVERVRKGGKQNCESWTECCDCDFVAGDSGTETADSRFGSKFDFHQQHRARGIVLADSFASQTRTESHSSRKIHWRESRRNDFGERFVFSFTVLRC